MFRRTVLASSLAAVHGKYHFLVNCSEDRGSFWPSSQPKERDSTPDTWKLSAGTLLSDEKADAGMHGVKDSQRFGLAACSDGIFDQYRARHKNSIEVTRMSSTMSSCNRAPGSIPASSPDGSEFAESTLPMPNSTRNNMLMRPSIGFKHDDGEGRITRVRCQVISDRLIKKHGGFLREKSSVDLGAKKLRDSGVEKKISPTVLVIGNLENKGERYTKRVSNPTHQEDVKLIPLEEDDECSDISEEITCSLNALHIRGQLKAMPGGSEVHDNSETAHDIGSNQTAACAATWSQCNASTLEAPCCVLASEGRSDRTVRHLMCQTTGTNYYLCIARKKGVRVTATGRDQQEDEDGDEEERKKEGYRFEKHGIPREAVEGDAGMEAADQEDDNDNSANASTAALTKEADAARTLQARRRRRHQRRRRTSSTTTPHVAERSAVQETSPATMGTLQTRRRRRRHTSTTAASAIPASTTEETLSTAEKTIQTRHLQRRRRTSTTVAGLDSLESSLEKVVTTTVA
eukprot:TRINITY_DN44004_c0_g1_i1.p1 TRINITY_DN44004_c0_g1~~TRINITY_DN44004_c0_g1_i1.p1  ORF type:complete len:517 (-),score=96.73 TRINITY_DN44004_c0_g1_i1:246-1796(-)